ncbi:MAG TPA: alpha-L-fucosidase [Gemmatimonadales bacterium]|nr:alpha-L-fucosidase [Gemmatimonadales bacterium]
MSVDRRTFLATSAAALPLLRRSVLVGSPDRMAWWREARFGMFVHWGLYSILAGTWRGDERWAEWIRNNAEIPVGQYDRLVAEWSPTGFDPDRWAELAWRAGMRYVVLTTKHHDGFCLWPSTVGSFDVTATPSPRDICAALAKACRARGLRVGWYHSIMDWHHPDYLPRRPWEAESRPVGNADYARYFRYLTAQVEELLTGYGPIDVLWFDGQWESTWTHQLALELQGTIRRLAPGCLVNDRINGSGRPDGVSLGDFGTPENEIPETGTPGKDWESCVTMNDNWGYKQQDDQWKSPRRLALMLIETVSKGGNLLLNVGPMGSGAFPVESVERLEALGAWMAVHGDLLRGSSASRFGDAARFRSTTQGRQANLFVHDWRPGPLLLEGLAPAPVEAVLLHGDGRSAPLEIQAWPGAVAVILPAEAPASLVPCIRLRFAEEWRVGV